MTIIKYLASAGAALAVALGSYSASALTISPNQGPGALVQAILGPGISFSGAFNSGARGALGTFAGGQSAVGFDAGVLLTTGSPFNALGPNNTSGAGTSNGTAGDPQLNALIPGYATFDAASLTFDFTTTTGDLFFNYVFASEEYPEYVGSQFNDVFGFFVDGVNIALLPGTNTAVSINSVNAVSNPLFYVDNSSGSKYIQYDGLTSVLTASALGLSAGVHTIKLSIADAGDANYDSGVFIKAGSFSATAPTPAAVPELDATSGAGALLLLMVGGLIVTGRRRSQQLAETHAATLLK